MRSATSHLGSSRTPTSSARPPGSTSSLNTPSTQSAGSNSTSLGGDLTNSAVLIVENQLGRTDHGHLGQLLTYAAGTDAATIVWIGVRGTSSAGDRLAQRAHGRINPLLRRRARDRTDR